MPLSYWCVLSCYFVIESVGGCPTVLCWPGLYGFQICYFRRLLCVSFIAKSVYKIVYIGNMLRCVCFGFLIACENAVI